ncbi:UNKNOWN [Stylonychia lemnae]|uniref:Uncharacterized protein n=1 Tax=Stylonychia lemnae TaxID=5949 RepID=A0A077ZXG5_STYLE|nr:UNKNOWN [Stylonychia lemnae]|eukprot:CDW74246.1 UNKNOWN [Stylonychia lemnae]
MRRQNYDEYRQTLSNSRLKTIHNANDPNFVSTYNTSHNLVYQQPGSSPQQIQSVKTFLISNNTFSQMKQSQQASKNIYNSNNNDRPEILEIRNKEDDLNDRSCKLVNSLYQFILVRMSGRSMSYQALPNHTAPNTSRYGGANQQLPGSNNKFYGLPSRDVNSHAVKFLNDKPTSQRAAQFAEPQYNPEGRMRMDPNFLATQMQNQLQEQQPASKRKQVTFPNEGSGSPIRNAYNGNSNQNPQISQSQAFSPQKSEILTKSGSMSLISSFTPSPNGLVPNRKTIYDTYRIDSEYRENFNDPQNIYQHQHYGKPNYHVYKPYDQKQGMTRGLDFTPSTDEGQKYLDYKVRMTNDKESTNVGYAPAYQSIAHLNNPQAHRTSQKEAPKFDVLSSSYKVQ